MFFADIHSKSPLMDDLITKNNYLRIAIAIPINMCNGILANLLYLFAYMGSSELSVGAPVMGGSWG